MYFVILHHPNGYMGMTRGENSDFLATFDTEDEAETAGRKNIIGASYGFSVHHPDCTGPV